MWIEVNVLGDLRCFISSARPKYFAWCALTLDNNVPGLDADLDPLGDFKQFLGVAVAHLSANVHPPWCFAINAAACIFQNARRHTKRDESRGMHRFGRRERMVNVHVLHLGGCCGLADCRVGISKLAMLDDFDQQARVGAR